MSTAAAHERYQIVRKLDAGGMAEVYQGIMSAAHGVEKPVAIKRVLPHLAKNEKFIKMFIDEARLSMRMSHANIVQMFDVGVSNDTYFLVMEYVDGANLKTILDATRARGYQLPPEYSIWIMIEVAKGLDYAHSLTDKHGQALGIVHRDISPPNILLSRRGEVKIVDFGLAKASTQLEKTDPGVVKGKFSYLSPEVAAGGDGDARSDIFAVGILLFELLTGKRLFYGESDYHTVQLVRAARVPRPSAINPKIAPDLEAVMLRALARDPAARYQSGMELGSDLAQYLFAHGLRVTAFDVAKMVVDVMSTAPKRAEPSLIDALIQEELVRFTSLDESPQGVAPVAKTRAEADGARPLDAALFEDPRAWSLDGTTDSGAQTTPLSEKGAGGAQGGRARAVEIPPQPLSTPSGGLERKLEMQGEASRPGGAAPVPAGARAAARPDRERRDSGGTAGRVLLVTFIMLLVMAGGLAAAHVFGLVKLPLPIPVLTKPG